MTSLLCFMKPSKMSLQKDIVDDDGGCCPGSMTAEEFKVWLRQFDTDGDGRISRNELRRAMRVLRVRFTGRRARRGISYADADGDGYIDDSEIDGLVEFVRRTLGVRIVAC